MKLTKEEWVCLLQEEAAEAYTDARTYPLERLQEQARYLWRTMDAAREVEP